MHVEATTASPLDTDADTIIVGVFEGEDVARDVDGGALQALLDSGEARAELRRLAVLHAEAKRFVLVGLGERDRFDGESARVTAAAAHGRARDIGAKALCWEVPHGVDQEVVAGLVQGTLLHGYRFDRYKQAEDGRRVDKLILSARHDVSRAVESASVVARAQNRARGLGNTPSNDLSPGMLADYARELAERHPGVEVSVLEEDEIRRRGMGAFAAVAQGSTQEARLIKLSYQGAGGQGPRLAMVGKAVTFDSGGLSLKTAGSMKDMKFDMSGGAAVIEAIDALAELNVPARVMGVIGATENLPSGAAVKPGDIVRALDGTSIEINNTDAEGRLVLADCLCYAREEGCDRIIDLATLTGGIVTALGSVYAGLMSNDDRWAEAVQECGSRTGELVWRMPLHHEYAEMVKGHYAQMTNLTERREASAITGAEFLHRFVGEVPWAHLDIAGTAYDVRRSYFDKGATGFGVRLLVELAGSMGA